MGSLTSLNEPTVGNLTPPTQRAGGVRFPIQAGEGRLVTWLVRWCVVLVVGVRVGYVVGLCVVRWVVRVVAFRSVWWLRFVVVVSGGSCVSCELCSCSEWPSDGVRRSKTVSYENERDVEEQARRELARDHGELAATAKQVCRQWQRRKTVISNPNEDRYKIDDAWLEMERAIDELSGVVERQDREQADRLARLKAENKEREADQ